MCHGVLLDPDNILLALSQRPLLFSDCSEPGIETAALLQGGREAEVTAAALAAAAPLVTSLSTLGTLCCSCSPKRLIDVALTVAERVMPFAKSLAVSTCRCMCNQLADTLTIAGGHSEH